MLRLPRKVTLQDNQMLRLPRKVTLRHHQILRLPRKMTRIIYPRDIWNVIYNARRNRHHPPTSPNTAPATQNDSHHLSSWHMKRYLQCAEEQASPANLTKYCACHAKWLSWLIFVTYETLVTMRGATSITLQPHQMLPLPRKMIRIIDCRRIWNVIYNARSNRHHPPTSPNNAPATQNCTPKSKKNLPKTVEASMPMRGRFEHDPTMIRAWTRHLAPARSPRLLFALRRRILYWKLQHFALRLSTQISPNTAPVAKSDTPTSPNTAPATKSDTPTSPCYWTELLLDCHSTVTELTCYWAVTKLSCYSTVTGLLLNWPVTELLELLLNWAVTELLLNWAVTELLLNCYWTVTQLLLNWTDLLLSC